MKRLLLFLLTAIVCGNAICQDSQRQRLEKHLYTLAADSLNGRKAGTDDAFRASKYIEKQWSEMGLKPFVGSSYRMPFSLFGSDKYCNLVAIIEGSDPVLKDEYIILGAHYDHIGIKNGEVCNGADDNASGSTCLIEVARQLLADKTKLRRSVIICAFDAEEIGLFGSQEFAKYLSSNSLIERVQLMMSIDMVGWYKANGSLIMEGTGTLSDGNNITNPTCLGVDINIKNKTFENSIFTATDTEPFAKKGIATLAVTTGLKSPYHKPQDDADLIDYEGLDLITNYITALTVSISKQESDIPSGKVAFKHREKKKAFSLGVCMGYNTSNLHFHNAAVIGKSLYGGQAGLMMQFNLSEVISLRADALYSFTRCRMTTANDAFGNGFKLQQQSATIPVMLQFNFGNILNSFYLNLGGYYSRTFEGKFYDNVPESAPSYLPNPDQWGIVWGLGMRLGYHLQLDLTSYYQCNNIFLETGGLPKARKTMFTCSLGYYF